MSLDDKLSASDILRMSGMIDDPGYYSGRGATLSDLDDSRLEKIYQRVLQAHGKDSAHEFALLVEAVPTLTATDFILTFLRLGANGWKWDETLLGNERGTYIGNEGQAFAEVVNALSGRKLRDETSAIRAPFLKRHAAEYQRKGIEGGVPYFRKF